MKQSASRVGDGRYSFKGTLHHIKCNLAFNVMLMRTSDLLANELRLGFDDRVSLCRELSGVNNAKQGLLLRATQKDRWKGTCVTCMGASGL